MNNAESRSQMEEGPTRRLHYLAEDIERTCAHVSSKGSR